MRTVVQSAPLADRETANPVPFPTFGKPLTHNERRVYQELCAAGTPMKAYALLEILQEEGIRAPMSVYRALDALIDRGIVKKIASLNAFTAVQKEAEQTVGAIVICRRCRRTRKVSLNEAQIVNLLAPADMTVEDVLIEAFGDCRNPNCAEDA